MSNLPFEAIPNGHAKDSMIVRDFKKNFILAAHPEIARLLVTGSMMGELLRLVNNYSIYAQSSGVAPFGATAEESAVIATISSLIGPTS